jgi:hypothetical protein
VARRQGLENGWNITARKHIETVIRVGQPRTQYVRSLPSRCGNEQPDESRWPRPLNLPKSRAIRGPIKASEIDGIPLAHLDALDLVARFDRRSTHRRTFRGGKRMAARVLHWMMRRKIPGPTRASMRS